MKYYFLLLFLSCFCFAQKHTAIYVVKIRHNPEENYFKEENHYLDIEDKYSVFRSERDRQNDSLVLNGGRPMGKKPLVYRDLFSKKNFQNDKVFKIYKSTFGDDRFAIQIEEKLNWKLINEKQKIGELICHKAETNYGGRHWEAWYTIDIPLPEGPYIFNGLPGLIVKITDSQLHYDFQLATFKKVKDTFFPKNKEIVSTWKHYQNLISQYYNDPFHEVRQFGMPIIFADENGNKKDTNERDIIRLHQKKIKREGSNIIEIDKFPAEL